MVKKFGFIFISVIALMVLFNNLIMPWYVRHTNLVEVPNVVGLNFTDAKRVVEDAGLIVKQGDIKYDETKPIGMVLEQNPPSGQLVKDSRRIYVTICGGEQLIEVPRLIGRSIRDARFLLQQRGLDIGESVKKFSNEYPDEYIISQIIQPGSKVKKDTKIDLIISNGPEIGNLRVPDIVNKSLQEARNIITEAKLRVGKITYIGSSEAPGKVLDQYPKKDKSANENTQVDIFVSRKIVIEDPFPIEEADTELPEDQMKDTDTELRRSESPQPSPVVPKDEQSGSNKDNFQSKPLNKDGDNN